MKPEKAKSAGRQAVVRLLPKPDLMQIYQATNVQDSERTIIGALLHDGELFHQLAADLQPGDFGGLQYAMIYRAMQEIAARGDSIDAVMVADELTKPDYKALSGTVTLESLVGMLREPPRTTLLETHVKRIRETALRVRLFQAADDIQAKVLDKSLSIEQVVMATDALVDSATERGYQRPSDMLSIASAFYDQVEASAGSRSMLVSTGMETLDEIIGGFGEGELSVLAGDSGKGKTTVMLSMVRNALRRGRRVALFSLEMTQAEICRKLVTMLTGIPAQAFRLANLTPQQMTLFTSAIGTVADYPLDIIDDYPELTPGQFERRARQLLSRQDVDLFVIDGLWLMRHDEPKEQRFEEVSRITKALLKFSKSVQKPVLLLHQYNQNLDKRADKTPTLSDLAESAAVRRDAQLILGLHRVSYAGQRYDVSQCWILKDRASGRAGDMTTLFFDGERQAYYTGQRATLEEQS